jgi:hypothetical protein
MVRTKIASVNKKSRVNGRQRYIIKTPHTGQSHCNGYLARAERELVSE